MKFGRFFRQVFVFFFVVKFSTKDLGGGGGVLYVKITYIVAIICPFYLALFDKISVWHPKFPVTPRS